MIGVGATHHLIDLALERTLRPMFLDDRHQLLAARHRKDHVADPALRYLDRRTGDVDQQPFLAIDLLDVARDAGNHLALRAHPTL